MFVFLCGVYAFLYVYVHVQLDTRVAGDDDTNKQHKKTQIHHCTNRNRPNRQDIVYVLVFPTESRPHYSINIDKYCEQPFLRKVPVQLYRACAWI